MKGDRLIPVFLVTGFLGSGKTTLIKALLDGRAGAETAIIVNEIGDIPIDHHLLSFVSEKVVVLPGGCVCCTVREDLEVTFRALYEARAAGTCSTFSRIVLETTGLADPVPIIATLKSNPEIRSRFFLNRVITTVDLIHGERTIASFPEAAKQVSVADQLVVTKCDIGEGIEALLVSLRAINPGADLLVSADAAARDLFSHLPLYDPPDDIADVPRWLSSGQSDVHRTRAASNHDGTGFETLSWSWDCPIDWTVFSTWLTMLLAAHGDKIVRVKALLDVANARGPVVVHGVQHSIDPPVHLAGWADFPRGSHIVFIMHALRPADVLRSFRAFLALEVKAAGLERYSRPVGAGGTASGRPIRRPSAPAWIKS